MPASSSATPSSANGRRTSRSAGAAKNVLVLKLSSDLLGRFASHPPSDTKGKRRSKASEIPAGTPVKARGSSPASSSGEPPLPPSSVDNGSDAGSTPVPPTSSMDTPRGKGMPPKTGTKRGLNQTNDSAPRPRGKPGPKKKPRLDDGSVDPAKLVASHRLGPKANTGAINAGLRALDRTGAPCRKWERKPLQLKSFTGIQWALPTWRSPRAQKPEDNGETKEVVLEPGDSDSKVNPSASGIPSEKSNSGDGELTPAPHMTEASSSAPPIAMTA